MTRNEMAQMSRDELMDLVLMQAQQIAVLQSEVEALRQMSIAAPSVPVIAALICTTKRSVDGVRIPDLLGHQNLI
jgi:hypothetical protein